LQKIILDTFAQYLTNKKTMKKSILLLAVAAMAFTSCKQLKENEYEVTGELDKSFDGKKAILQKVGGQFGFVPVDTVVIKDGEFIFKDTIKSAEMYYVTIDGIKGNLNFIMEPGSIELNVDKDTIAKSVTAGTYNNEKLEEFKNVSKKMYDKGQKFSKLNKDKYSAAQMQNDTVTMNKIMKEQKVLLTEVDKEFTGFMKANPKAFYNLYVLEQVAQMGVTKMDDAKKLFDGFDASVKSTKRGKEVADIFAKYEAQKNAPAMPPAAAAPEAGVKVGDAAPQFTAPTPDGKAVSLKQSMGKVTIVDFWAKWCGPCRAENPNMVALYNEYHAKGLNIVGVSLDDNAADWKKAIADDKLTWTHVSNLKKWQDPIAMQYGVNAIPATYVLDATGKVVASNLRGAELKAKVAELLK
jgi:peroxiredoxin